ncbi:MAG: hypothetical protein A2Y62_03175 [Candidatus Fischerbacteria bacterium RBG_13_37_8]|uniref:Metallo-beta-lactamase domain-containing protein n=1 Tax=Candidatus Fischerbacteria bacterium RBG_13_37_8 TaxID=1817863 RepID=A0A1F5VVD1_9BACT|nr:MAG: hypothetical protein A2Y62_03175 [Candidatus Fischerbacteria bacterium RBG_13_37_8]
MWVSIDNTNILIDPGPGSLVKILNSKPKLNPASLDAIYISHRHIDHCNDASIMIEAMTQGGTKKRGMLFLPADVLDEGGAIFPHTLDYLSTTPVILKENGSYTVNTITLTTPVKHIHTVDTYGCIIKNDHISIGYIADTAYFASLAQAYPCDVLILNVVLTDNAYNIQHLSVIDAEKLIEVTTARVIVLTHFGMRLLRAKPWLVVEEMKQKYHKEIIAASDGMRYELGTGD